MPSFHHPPIHPVITHPADKKGSKEDTKRLKKEYEDKLSDMKERLLKLNAAKKEHKKLMVSQGNYERRLGTLQSEMSELKRIKVTN